MRICPGARSGQTNNGIKRLEQLEILVAESLFSDRGRSQLQVTQVDHGRQAELLFELEDLDVRDALQLPIFKAERGCSREVDQDGER